jgi:hypothetical protein
MKTENYIQQEIIIWFNNNYCLVHHNPRCMILSIPNGGSRDRREGKTLKNTGLLPGASDLIVLLPPKKTQEIHGKTIYVEVKTPEGYQSKAQKDFQMRVESLSQVYALVRSLEQFKELITTFLET